jgi:hypothetical protein
MKIALRFILSLQRKCRDNRHAKKYGLIEISIYCAAQNGHTNAIATLKAIGENVNVMGWHNTYVGRCLQWT